MSRSYLVYQFRPEVYDIINENPQSEIARIAFDLRLLNEKSAEQSVNDALFHNMYYPTKFLHLGVLSESVDPLEAVFDAGNGYGKAKVTTLAKGDTSLSVGNIIVHLQQNKAYLCMPTGWHELARELDFCIKL
jgi:hypothetical protein